jgi:hypothetical protein
VQGRRHLAKAGEVMLDEKRAVIAERLGLDIVVDKFPEAGTTVDVRPAPSCLGTPEESNCIIPSLRASAAQPCQHWGRHRRVNHRRLHKRTHYIRDMLPCNEKRYDADSTARASARRHLAS